MYSPILQSTSSDASGLQCIIALVIMGVAWIILANLASKTKNASLYAQTVTTTLPREQIINLIERTFPKSLISREFNWKSSWPTSERLAWSGYYLTNGQGCLTLLLTGLIPGYLLVKYAMGRTEEVVIDFSNFEETQELRLEAIGLRARHEVDQLIQRLGMQKSPM